jgi:hypothetical protein
MPVHAPAVSPPFRYPEGTFGWAELRYREGLPVLSVAGSPEEMGAAVGKLALASAPRMSAYPEALLHHFCAAWLRWPLARLGGWMANRFPGPIRRELEAMIDAAGVPRQQAVIGNTLFDIKKILACSAVLVEPQKSGTGAPLLGRNLDYPSLGYAHHYSLVTIYHPTGRRPFASVGFPGLLGVLSGMNDAGLCLSVLEVFQSRLFTRRLDPWGVPYWLCFRRVLEECSTIEEAHALLRKMRRTTVFNLALADRARTAVLEATPRRIIERRPENGTGTCTNHFCSTPLRPLWGLNVYRTYDRLEVLRRIVRSPAPLDVPGVHRALHSVHQGDHTLQTMVFEPAGLRLHLAVGDLPSSAGPLRSLELAPLFASPSPGASGREGLE